ncbi:condensin subunit BRN1 [Sporobolomyces salmoneus]|uniref:condensin subunit BRN1 n=1 Tax=Sporobolomyces salmoneus TaxID=183962 RepID=UPI00316FF46E
MPRLNKGRRSSLAPVPADPSLNNNPPAPANPRARLGVLAAAQHRLQRESLGGSGGAGGGQRNVSGILGAGPLVVESQRYEEWMKIATDNKITSTNTWNLALIDYFHDMSLLRNGDGDNSINFQKASCTLDGCVKIWTSRVDSVATETGKLLSGLGEEGNAHDGDGEEEDEDGNDGDGDEGKEGGRKGKKRTNRATATLADDFSKIRIKSFDLEFTVDPLFKKTSADFDEGGAGGILMNHLGCDGNMKVVFDAGDAKLECVEEEDEAERDEEEEEEEGVEVDIAKLREKCIPQGLISLSSMHLTPSLASFHFSADPNSALVLDLLNLASSNDDNDEGNERPPNDYNFAPNNAGLAGDAEDFGGFDDYGPGGDDFGGGFEEGERLPDFTGGDGGEVDFFADQFSGAGPRVGAGAGAGSGGGGGGAGYGAVESFDPRRAGTGERDLVMAMDGNGPGTAEEDTRGLFDYFDGTMGKNWAGPQHWKMRRTAKKVDESVDAPSAAKKPRKEKVPFTLDFSAEPPLSKEELFQPAATKSSILLPGSTAVAKKGSRKSTQNKEDRDDHTLPDDYQFNSNVLLRLFLKPKTTLKMRRRGPAALPANGADPAAEDVAFWAQAGASNGGGVAQDGIGELPIGPDGELDYGGFDGGDFGGGGDDDDPPPFDTQWLASGDGDEPDPVSEAEEDLAALTLGQLKRVKPETVNYAKRAKRIDVKKLKDTMWKELEEVALPVKKFPTSLVYEPSAPPEELVLSSDEEEQDTPRPRPRGVAKKEALLPVVSSLRRLYPKDKMSEISTSYMFICLLHLANEKGLRIQTPAIEFEEGEDEGSAVGKRVGGLEALRVLKEVGGAY